MHSSIVMDQVVRSFLVLCLAVVLGLVNCQELPGTYNARSTAGAGAGMCSDTQKVTESIRRDIYTLIDKSVLPTLVTQNHNISVLPVFGTGPGHGACGCGGSGWRRAAYLNMSDPTQTCPPAWELITTPRRFCAWPNSTERSCYSAMFSNHGIQYSHVCGRIIGYQFGVPRAFRKSYIERSRNPQTIDDPYVDGLSVTYGSPRKHIWTFAASIDEYWGRYNLDSKCTCTRPSSPTPPPWFVGNDYFCETGVPGYFYSVFNHPSFPQFLDDPLWDGQGCGPISTCCTFNDPPWFCKQLPESTSADLEVRLCESYTGSEYKNTPVELMEIYVRP